MKFDEQKELEALEEKGTSSEVVFSGKLLHVYRDTITLPNGNEATREYIKHNGAVAVVPLTEDGRVIVERQYRYPFHSVLTEIPAGKLDSVDEAHLEAAKRELKEETGYEADEWIELGAIYPSIAYTTETIWMYLARGLHKGERNLDEDEFLSVHEVPLEELVEEVMKGTIGDAKTQSAILKAARYLGK
ncbi:MAG: NUDIX hydrolase [Spirochaetales bacterium]|nr:NUDIX hydrolase [Candidatus Physcosoma equi]